MRSAWKEGAKAFGKGVLAEIGEEELIAALDTAFVQTRIEPGMTGAQFMKRLYDTAITTAFASGGFAVALDLFQKKWGISDERLKAIHQDMGNIHREWKPQEKFRLLSDGTLMPNYLNSAWLDSGEALAMVERSGASAEAKLQILRNLGKIQHQIAETKLEAYHAAAAAADVVADARPVRGFFLRAGGMRDTLLSPEEWAEEKGIIPSSMDTAAFVLAYEAALDARSALEKNAHGYSADAVQASLKVASSVGGLAGLCGWDAAGAWGAENQELSAKIGQGQFDTGLSGKAVEESLNLAIQIFLTRGIGSLAAGAGRVAATEAAAATAGTVVRTAATEAGRRAAVGTVEKIASGTGSAVLSGLSSSGQGYAQELAEIRKEGLEGEALEKRMAGARANAVRGGVTTFIITGLFQAAGAGGAERLGIRGATTGEVKLADFFRAMPKDQVAKNLGKLALQTGIDITAEGAEEALDTFVQAFINAKPDSNLADVWQQSWESAKLGMFIGGASHAVSTVVDVAEGPEAGHAGKAAGKAEAATPPARLTAEQIAALATHEAGNPAPRPAHAAAPQAVRGAYRNQAHEDILSAARLKGVEEGAAGRAAADAAPHIAAARSLADTGIGRALPGLKKALARLPEKLQEAALGWAQRRADASPDTTASTTTLDTVADALSRDLPGTRWRDGRDGVLDAPWAEDPALLPGLLPIAIAGAHAGLHGSHRTATFAAATDTQLRAMGVADADISAIRAGLENSPHHAARAIDGAFSRLDPRSDTARAAQAELASAASSSGYDESGSSLPTVTRLPDGSFRVDDADGNEIGTAKDADGVERLVDGLHDNSSAQGAEGHAAGNGGGGRKPPGKGNGSEGSSNDDGNGGNPEDSSSDPSDRNESPIAPSPAGNPYRDKDGKLTIESHPDAAASPRRAAKEKEFIRILNQPIEIVDRAYNAIKDTFGGKVISTDLPRDLLPSFARSKVGALLYTAITGNGSRAYGRDRFWREINDPRGRNKLAITAGGVAAGKSTATGKGLIHASDLIYDGTLRETDWAIKNIERAVEMGWETAIHYVQRPLRGAAGGVVSRAMKIGRIFPLANLPIAHLEAQRSIIKIAKHFANNPSVKIHILLNDGPLGTPPAILRLEDIDKGGKYSYEHSQETNDPGRTNSVAREMPPLSDRISDGSFQEAAVAAIREAAKHGNTRRRFFRELLRQVAKGDSQFERTVGEILNGAGAIRAEDAAKADMQTTPEGIEEKKQGQLPDDNLSQDAATDEDFFDDMEDDGDVLHERRAKHRKREGDGQKKDLAEAKGILSNVRKLASNWMTNEQHEQQSRRKMLFAAKVTTTPEERMILKSRYEIMLVYSREGRLKSAHGGSREQSKKPLFSPGDILSHNHPGGRGPSDTDLKLALEHPEITVRIVAKNENGATEIFQIRAKKAMNKAEIEEMTGIYKWLCDDEGDTHAARRKALHLLYDLYSPILEITSTNGRK